MMDIDEIKKWVGHNFFKKRDYTSTSRGAQDANRPLILDALGHISDTFFYPGRGQVYTYVASGATLTIVVDYQYIVADTFTVVGTVDAYGDLVVI